MAEKLVQIYEALTFSDAEMLADRLNDAGIESFVDLTDAPIDGLVAGPQAKKVRVNQRDAAQARQIVRQFEGEGKVGVHGPDEQQREETGQELSTEVRPKDDSPGRDIRAGQNERLDEGQPSEAPEVADMLAEPVGMDRQEIDNPRIRSFGADRPLAQDPEVESDDIENQPIDQLDVSGILDEPETGTPAANLKGPNRQGEDRGRRSGGGGRSGGGTGGGGNKGGARRSGSRSRKKTEG